jgi:hypothetical protein
MGHRVGFSTGALARGDFRAGIELQRGQGSDAIELSALREHELQPLIDALPSLDLADFTHVSVHAPAGMVELDAGSLTDLLSRLPEEWPIIVHPTVIGEPEPWRRLGARLCIENMDRRKPGRTVEELESVFDELEQSRFCLDLGHAAQIDPSLGEARKMIDRFGERLVQLHVSRLGPGCEHRPLDDDAARSFRSLARMIPAEAGLIIESEVDSTLVALEIERVREVFGR